MTTRAEYEKEWKDKTPEERREKLDEMASDHASLSEDQLREHDALATLVAADEDEALNEVKEDDGNSDG